MFFAACRWNGRTYVAGLFVFLQELLVLNFRLVLKVAIARILLERQVVVLCEVYV